MAVVCALVFLARPDRSPNRRLALVLLFEALNVAAAGVLLSNDAPDIVYAGQVVVDVAFALNAAAYLAFLATLSTPLVRPLRYRSVLAACVSFFLLVAVVHIARPDLFLTGVGPVGYARLDATQGTWFGPVLLVPGLAVFLFGFLAALSMWRRAARGSHSRTRGAVYAWAFGIRDVGWALFLAPGILFGTWHPLLYWASIGTGVAYGLLLAYGMIRHQLFDIELKIKVGISRGTVAAIFVAAFLVAFAIAEQYLQERYGWLVGGAAVGVLLIVFRRIERLGDKLADAAFPSVRDDEEYRLVRRRQVYRAALESAYEDGAITDKERGVLATLADQLGLGAHEALLMERQITRPEVS